MSRAQQVRLAPILLLTAALVSCTQNRRGTQPATPAGTQAAAPAGTAAATPGGQPAPDGAKPDSAAQRLSGPYTHANLTIWLVHGPDRLPGARFLTLQEAVERKLCRVHETGDVNELLIENLSKTHELFIQAGDIVRGGKQDRCIGVDVIVAPASKLPLPSFCVEHGRWQRRGNEDPIFFTRSDKQVSGRAIRLQVQGAADQGGVWEAVEMNQQQLSSNVGRDVRDAASSSSLLLSLENKAVAAATEPYLKELTKLAAEHADALGVVVAVNGELSTADVYAAHDLFTRLWPKLLESAAAEAVSLKDRPAAAPPQLAAVQAFLNAAQDAPGKARRVSDRVDYVTHDADKAVRFRINDKDRPQASVHENVIRK
ncbi:MAG: DUF6569 family protein [Planctomycetota bacterium]